jgi:hypothetical protein
MRASTSQRPAGALSHRRRSVLLILAAGIGALMTVFALAAVSSAVQTRSLANDTEELTGRVSTARTAVFEVEINAEELASPARAYLAGGDSGALDRVADARTDLRHFNAMLDRTGVVPDSRALLERPIEDYIGAADTLIALEIRQVGLLREVRAGLSAMDSLLDEHFQATAERSLPARPEVFQAAEEMEINLIEIGSGLWEYLAARDPRTRSEMRKDREQFEYFLGR